jgi:hypothetical protein
MYVSMCAKRAEDRGQRAEGRGQRAEGKTFVCKRAARLER